MLLDSLCAKPLGPPKPEEHPIGNMTARAAAAQRAGRMNTNKCETSS
jgi:hypothetical protein